MPGILNDKSTTLEGNRANIRPTPRASCTVLAATDMDLCDRDWKQRTILRFANVAFRLPASQLLLKADFLRIKEN